MKKSINVYGAGVLRKKGVSVKDFDKELQSLVDDMFDTMYCAEGVGLAAPQIGVSQSLCVIDPGQECSKKIVLINPEIISGEGEIVRVEGCLSVPEITGEVKRFEKIVVRAQDIHGKKMEFEADGLLSRVIQHEIDHINGVLFVDKLSPVRRILINGKLKKLMRKTSSEQ